jgi:hypothetical protein
MMHVCIKRAARRAIQPIPISADEMELDTIFRWPVAIKSTPGRPQVMFEYPGNPQAIDADKRQLEELTLRIALGQFRVDKSRLKGEIRRAMKPLLGVAHEAGGYAVYTSYAGDCTIETVIWFSPGGVGQCAYWHRIHAGKVEPESSKPMGSELLKCSITDLLGVAVTQWDCLTDADAPNTAQLIADATAEFLSAAPGIILSARDRDAADASP